MVEVFLCPKILLNIYSNIYLHSLLYWLATNLWWLGLAGEAVHDVSYRILSHGALPLDLRSNAGILYVASSNQAEREALPGP